MKDTPLTITLPIALTTLLAAASATAETVLDNGNVRLTFDDRGWVTSMTEKPTGRELVRHAISFVTVRDKARWEKNAVRLEQRGANRYAWIFDKDLGEAVFTVTPFEGGWTFRNETCTVKDCPEMEFCRLDPVCRKYDGSMANVLSDDESAVMVCAYSVKADMGRLWVRTFAKPNRGLTGHAAGLFAGPREKLIPAWKAMTLAADAPHSTAGGAWALESSSSNGSYLFSVPAAGTWPEWLELVRRSGFSTHHVICWGTNDAYYEPNKNMFPGGCAEMREVAANLHAVGKNFSIHTYTSALGASKFVTPECDSGVLVRYSYTLAKPLASNDTEIVVNEKPGKNHWLQWNYNGANVLRTKFARAATSCGRPVVIESSDWTPHSGWFHSRIGALDPPCWGVKRFHDRHVADVAASVKANFIPYHLG